MGQPTVLTLFGEQWMFTVLDDDDYVKLYGDDSAGMTVADSYRVDFCESELSLKLVVHELTHVYWHYLCVNSANLKPDQLEEVACELMALHGSTILKTSRALYKQLK